MNYLESKNVDFLMFVAQNALAEDNVAAVVFGDINTESARLVMQEEDEEIVREHVLKILVGDCTKQVSQLATSVFSKS